MPQKFHNIGILAHVDSGKTTLTEQLLYLSGAIRHAGSVDAGTTATDTLSIEKQRGISVRAAAASTEWNGVTVNIIDTPGHIDFAGEVERALTALDYAVVIVSAVEGVRAHTENILKALDTAQLPRVIFINKADRAGADVQKVTEELKSISASAIITLNNVENEGCDVIMASILALSTFLILMPPTIVSKGGETIGDIIPKAWARSNGVITAIFIAIFVSDVFCYCLIVSKIHKRSKRV